MSHAFTSNKNCPDEPAGFTPDELAAMHYAETGEYDFDYTEVELDAVRDAAEIALGYPGIAEAAHRWYPSMSRAFGLVAPEDLADEILAEFGEYFPEGEEAAVLAEAIAGLLLFPDLRKEGC